MTQYDFGAGGFIIDVYIEQHYPPCLTYWYNHIEERRAWNKLGLRNSVSRVELHNARELEST